MHLHVNWFRQLLVDGSAKVGQRIRLHCLLPTLPTLHVCSVYTRTFVLFSRREQARQNCRGPPGLWCRDHLHHINAVQFLLIGNSLALCHNPHILCWGEHPPHFTVWVPEARQVWLESGARGRRLQF